MKFSKGKVAALAIAGVVALGGISGSLAWGIKEAASTNGSVTTEDAVKLEWGAGDYETPVLLNPYGSVKKSVTVSGLKSSTLVAGGRINFTFTGNEQALSANVRILVSNSDSLTKADGVNAKILSKVDNTFGFDFDLDGNSKTYYLEYSLDGVLAESLATANTGLGNLTISLATR